MHSPFDVGFMLFAVTLFLVILGLVVFALVGALDQKRDLLRHPGGPPTAASTPERRAVKQGVTANGRAECQ